MTNRYEPPVLAPAKPTALDLIREAIEAWPQYDGDGDGELHVSGADLVDWFGEWRERAKGGAGMNARAHMLANVSSLVATLAGSWGCIGAMTPQGLYDLASQAAELAAPIPDYESAARENGWGNRSAKAGYVGAEVEIAGGLWHHAGENVPCSTAEAACLLHDIDPYYREALEHWIVSDWLADKLEAKGEKVDRDFAGLTVWACTSPDANARAVEVLA